VWPRTLAESSRESYRLWGNAIQDVGHSYVDIARHRCPPAYTRVSY